MAYSSITKPTDYFNTKLYTGNGGTQSITGVGFQPDYVWLKERTSNAVDHKNVDSVRGANKKLESNTDEVEGTTTNVVTSFDSDGFSLGNSGSTNGSSDTYASWNWLAGGTTPSQTYTVKVVSDGGNKYRFDDFGTSAVTLDLQEGGTYTFDGSDSSMASHPIKLSETSNGTHGGGSSYNTGVTYQLDGSSVTESAYVSGYSSASSRKLIITVAASAPTLYYYCHYHSGMGGQVNTNSLFGSSNFKGAVQSLVSANTTAGFSIVKWTGTGSATTVGHGLGVAPTMIWTKNLIDANDWFAYTKAIGYSMSNPDPETDYLKLNQVNSRTDDSSAWNDTAPTSTVFSVGNASNSNGSSDGMVAYCFTDIKGYSKIGSYTGNGSTDGTFIYTGFKPAWVVIKRTDANANWVLLDNKRDPFNGMATVLNPNDNAVDNDMTDGSGNKVLDMLSNGFKIRDEYAEFGGSGAIYIYMAFAENPFVANDSGTAVPVTAR